MNDTDKVKNNRKLYFYKSIFLLKPFLFISSKTGNYLHWFVCGFFTTVYVMSTERESVSTSF